MGGSGWVWRIWNFMTQIQPDPLSKQFCNLTQPNPTQQALKIDSTWRVGLDRVGFGRLAAHP